MRVDVCLYSRNGGDTDSRLIRSLIRFLCHEIEKREREREREL